MTQLHSDLSREALTFALPDVEVFYAECLDEADAAGWYYWSCLPGCLPDGDAIGPFASEQEAIDDMHENWINEEAAL